jgi:pilus assembly protein CpaB
MNRRLSLLAIAVVVALLGTVAVFSYVSRMESSTLAGAEPVDVLVAAQQIPSGTSADAVAGGQLVQVLSVPRKAVPEGALSTLDGIGAQTLVSDVYAGEMLLRAKFADQTSRTGALLIPEDKIAISVELGDPQRVAGFVVPGSEVAVFATVEKRTASVTATATQDGDTAQVDATAEVDDRYTQLLLPRTSVIAVGPATLRPEEREEGDEAVGTAVLTVAVTQEEAEKLVHGVRTGELYFGLLNSTSKTEAKTGVDATNLFSWGAAQ